LDENEVKARLEREAIPNVDGYQVTIKEDSTGDIAAFIFVTVPDDVSFRPDYFEQTRIIDYRILEVFNREFPGFWPYVRFRSVSEMATR